MVAVCTYNELANLPELLSQIRQALPLAAILVVDDNSPDGTPRWLQQQQADFPQLHPIIRTNERGLGGALKAAMTWACQRDYQWLLNLDADHSHDPADLPRLLQAASSPQKPCDVVVGTRYAPGGQIEGWSLRRKLMSRMVNRFATSVLRLPVSDCSGSLRCYRLEKLRELDPQTLTNDGYAIFEEVLLRLRESGARFGEVPITFHERREGTSKLTLTESLRSAGKILRLAGSKLRW